MQIFLLVYGELFPTKFQVHVPGEPLHVFPSIVNNPDCCLIDPWILLFACAFVGDDASIHINILSNFELDCGCLYVIENVNGLLSVQLTPLSVFISVPTNWLIFVDTTTGLGGGGGEGGSGGEGGLGGLGGGGLGGEVGLGGGGGGEGGGGVVVPPLQDVQALQSQHCVTAFTSESLALNSTNVNRVIIITYRIFFKFCNIVFWLFTRQYINYCK